MTALHVIAVAPKTAPAGRGAGMRAQVSGAAQYLDPRTR